MANGGTSVDKWLIFQRSIGVLVVTALIAVTSSLVGLRDTIIKHDLLINQLIIFKNDGERYTQSHGDNEAAARTTADAVLSEKIESLSLSQEQQMREFHVHLTDPDHPGARHRLLSIEKDISLLSQDLKELRKTPHLYENR